MRGIVQPIMAAMKIRFTKMHGAGNDFVFLDCLKNNYADLETIAKKLCDRRFGIGADVELAFGSGSNQAIGVGYYCFKVVPD